MSSVFSNARTVVTVAACQMSATKKYTNGHTNEEAIVAAAGSGDLEAVQEFLKAGVDVNARNAMGSTALMDAAGAGSLDVVKALVARGADVNIQNKDGWTALHAAVNGDQPRAQAQPIVAFLLESGAHVDLATTDGLTPLMLAVQGKQPKSLDIVQALIAGGADVNAHNK